MAKKGGKQKETAQEKALAQVTAERLNRYMTVFQPMQQQYVRDVLDAGPTLEQRSLGIANVDTQQQFANVRPRVEQGVTNRGVGLGSGAFNMASTGVGQDQATAGGLLRVDARNASRNQQYQNLDNLVQLGQGQASEAMKGFGSLATQASKQATIDAQASLAARNAMGRAIGTAAGYGMGYKLDQLQNPAPGSAEAFMKNSNFTPIPGGDYVQPSTPYSPNLDYSQLDNPWPGPADYERAFGGK